MTYEKGYAEHHGSENFVPISVWQIPVETRKKAIKAVCGARACKDAKDALFILEILGLIKGVKQDATR